MRCKVGDLVEVIGASTGPAPVGFTCPRDPLGMVGTITGLALSRDRDWSVYLPAMPAPTCGGTWAALDAQLRPIRDADGEDETLSWASVPQTERDSIPAEALGQVKKEEV